MRPEDGENHASARNGDLCDTFDPSRDRIANLKERILDVAGLSEVFRVLGDETRTRLIYLLSLEELCVCDLAELLDISVPAVSHHLRLLRAMRLVRYRREGKSVRYSLDDDHIMTLIRQAQAHFGEGR